MIIIDDDKRILNLNHMAIYLMLTAEEMAEYKDKLKTLNSFHKLTRGIFRFEIVEKGDTPYEMLPKEMTRTVTNCNVLVRLINSIHSIYCYGLDTIDLKLDEQELRAELSSIVDDVCKKNIKQMDILCERQTGTAMQAVREYRAINIVKDTFECALEGIIPKEGTIEQIETYGRTADMKESLELVKGTTSDIYKDKIERERAGREVPGTHPTISITVSDVTFEDKKGRRKKGKGFVFKINDDVISVPFNKIDQTMLYSSVLIASVYGIKLKRYDFTKYSSKEKKIWLKKVFSALCFDERFEDWFEKINRNGPAARINDAKSKVNKALWDILSNEHKDAYYYCLLVTKNDHTDKSEYVIRTDKNRIHIADFLMDRLD